MKKIHVLLVVLLLSFGAQKSSADLGIVTIPVIVLSAVLSFGVLVASGVGISHQVTAKETLKLAKERVALYNNFLRKKLEFCRVEMPVRLKLQELFYPQAEKSTVIPTLTVNPVQL